MLRIKWINSLVLTIISKSPKMRKLGIFSYDMIKKNFIPLQIIIFNIL